MMRSAKRVSKASLHLILLWILICSMATASTQAALGATSTMWMEYGQVVSQPLEWWGTDEARALGERIIRGMQTGKVYIDVPVSELERQLGYAWYGTWPEQLLKQAYRDSRFDALYESLLDLEEGLELGDALPEDAVQIGGLVMAGYHYKDGE